MAAACFGAQSALAKTFEISDKKGAQGAMPLTLREAYSLALKTSETIAINDQVIREAEAHFLQALGTLLPHVSFSSQDIGQDISGSPTSLRHSFERAFVFKQRLFSGFREFVGISAGRLERSQRINEKIRAQQLLYNDVSDAFYLLIEQREDLRILQTVRNALLDRIVELRQRIKVGRSRRSELVSTQAQLYIVDAQIETDKSQEAVARQLLEFLVGRSVGQLADTYIGPLAGRPESYYTARSADRPDVKASKQAWEVAKKASYIAKTDFFPTIDAEGDYFAWRNTVPSDGKWEALLSINVPIFQGTDIIGNVKEANAKAEEARLTYLRLDRSAVQDIRDAYAQFTIGLSRNRALKKSLAASEMDYYLQRSDYKLNLVNNLDVLTAIQTLEEARRNFTQSLYENERLYLSLLVASGENLPQ